MLLMNAIQNDILTLIISPCLIKDMHIKHVPYI